MKRERFDVDACMERLAKGDREAFTPVFRALWPITFRYCYRYLRTQADAEDAAQRALEKLFRQASRYKFGSNTATWALSLAYWECRTTIQKRIRLREVDPDAKLPSGTHSPSLESFGEQGNRGALEAGEFPQPPDKQLESKEEEAVLRDILDTLGDKEKELLGLSTNRMEELPETISRAGKRKRKQRLLESLRRKFGDRWKATR